MLLEWNGGKDGNLRAVSDDEERLPIYHECLNVIGLANLENVDVLDLDELVSRGVALVNMRAPEQLSHNDKEVMVNHHGLADDSGGTSTGKQMTGIKTQKYKLFIK